MSGPRRIDLAAADPRSLAAKVTAARLMCFPTDTVYGIGGALTPAVYEAIVRAKGRDAGRPLQVVYPSLELLEASVTLEPRVGDAVRRLLPGPFTLLVPYPPDLTFPPAGAVRHEAQGQRGAASFEVATLGVRVPAWPAAARALARLPFALLASSANPSGGAAPRALDEVDAGLLAACDLLLDAGPVGGRASTIVDLSLYARDGRWRILRLGTIAEDGVAELLAGAGKEPLSP